MQRNGCKINEAHINTIALKARLDNRECGYLWKRSSESGGKWQIKWFALYQNFLFYYENVNGTKPLGLILLESCYCNRIVANTKNTKEGEIKLYCFSISYTKDGKNSMEFGAESEDECNQWIESIANCSYNKQASQNAELNQKYIHLTQLFETESKSKWQYLSQIEELSNEVKTLRDELKRYKKQHYLLRSKTIADEECTDMKRIKKVQSLCRGWLYRRRWKRIVKDYIESPQATSLRKRNRIVFELVEKEGEYKSQLECLVSNFLRPFKMAACSSKPPITHEEVNCIFLNSEILLFLHQIFYKGLTRKLENWPSVFVGDLFDFLLPVLVIYQEYVRNHHYSLQILTDLKSKSIEFRNLLKRCEEKSKCEGRSLDVFLTYPMHQIPRYIIILHQLISHTCQSSTNELKSLESAKEKLEELSRTMHDEVSETENIRCNLGIEKMIVEGCDVILDANQVFIKEGLLILLTSFKSKTLGVKVKDARKRNVVKCFLFTNHLIVTTRASNGRLNLFKPYEAIPLGECKIIEDISNEISSIEEENPSILSDDHSVISSTMASDATSASYFYNSSSREHLNDNSCEFKLIQTNDTMHRSIHFVASSVGEKQAWCSDMSQCIDNLNYSNLLQNTNTSNSVNMPNSAIHIDDPRLFNDEKDVKYCKSLNSCKVPQIRQATLDKLIERLTDLRFLSIDFLNTFLLTYRVYTDSLTVLNALRVLYESSPKYPVDGQAIIKCESNELNRRISVAGIYRLPSIAEQEHDIGTTRINNKHRNSHIGTIRRDMAIDIESLNCVNLSDEGANNSLSEAGPSVHFSSTPKTSFEISSSSLSSSASSIPQQYSAQFTPFASSSSYTNSFIAKEATSNNNTSSSSSGTTTSRKTSLNVLKFSKLTPIVSCENIAEMELHATPDNLLQQQQQQQPQLVTKSSSSLSSTTTTTTDHTTTMRPSTNAVKRMSNGLIESVTRASVSDGILGPGGVVATSTTTTTPLATNSSLTATPTTKAFANLPTLSSMGATLTTVLGSSSSTEENDPSILDYNSDEDANIKQKFNNLRTCRLTGVGTRNGHEFASSNSSLNGSISSATSTATKFTYWNNSMDKNHNKMVSLSAKNSLQSVSISNTTEALALSPATAPKRNNIHKHSQSLTTNQLLVAVQNNAQKISKRLSDAFSQKNPVKLIEVQKKNPISVYAGVVVTSSRSSRRRISNSEATKAFAVATSGVGSQTSLNDKPAQPQTVASARSSVDNCKIPFNTQHRVDRVNSAVPALDTQKSKSDWVIVNTAASMRVLNVLRHWITKHPFDFDENEELKEKTLDLVNEMLDDENQLTETEKKVAQSIIQQLTLPLEKRISNRINLDTLLIPPETPGKVKLSDLSVSEIAEQMTYIDYQIFCSISSQELLGQAWMKPRKEIDAKNVLIFSKRFNEMSQLVVSEIVGSTNSIQRLEKLEKWTTIANICKFLKNFNGVLQIMSAFASTPVFRLKKTWEKLSKNSRQTIDTLQNLVSSDGRFKNLRDAMHKCDPPCIPYLGMYLMDLVFIEESTPDFLDGNLINFSKLRMVSHIIRDIRTFQHSKYTIHHNRRVCEYLLDTTGLMTPDEAYNKSLTLEPRTSLMTKKLET